MESLEQAELEVVYWRKGTAGSFTSSLLELLCRADRMNRERLRLGFPELVAAFEVWQDSPTEDEFCRKVLSKK